MTSPVVSDVPFCLAFVLHLRRIKIPPTIVAMISTTRPTGISMMVGLKLSSSSGTILGSVSPSVDETRQLCHLCVIDTIVIWFSPPVDSFVSPDPDSAGRWTEKEIRNQSLLRDLEYLWGSSPGISSSVGGEFSLVSRSSRKVPARHEPSPDFELAVSLRRPEKHDAKRTKRS